ncbi:OVARIAN TUMOR DOMAIN-containing deubiquitinating enzyme 12-like isoform X2 [Carex rostrata]
MYERDQHVFWGYDLFHGPFPNTSYYGDLNQPQNDFNYTDVLYSNEEVARSSHSDERYLHGSYDPHDYSASAMRVYSSGNDGDAGPSSSSSSPDQNSGAGEEWMDLSNYSEIDDEMEKRLYQMVPIRHVPRINGAIPSYDEATTDHERLTDRLQLYDVVERKVQGDGNCQFRALSDQFYRSPEHHQFVRQQIVSQLESHREMYEGYVPMPYNDYLEKLSESGQWGDHVTLQAAADTYGVKIFVLTSFKDTCYIEILPKVEKSKRVIFLSFWAEVHYNSIYPNGELPLWETKKKKKWWHFGNK